MSVGVKMLMIHNLMRVRQWRKQMRDTKRIRNILIGHESLLKAQCNNDVARQPRNENLFNLSNAGN